MKQESLDFYCIGEEHYSEEMSRLVEPYLKRQAECGRVENLYYEFYGRQEPKGTIVISYGFTESCEKYHELIYYMHRAGYQVMIWDHRGHGKSFREVTDSRMVHVEDFSLYVEDMHSLIQKVVMPRTQKKPLFLYAHSMGGCIGTLYLERHPGIFRKAVLNAPMFGINNGGVPDQAALLLCNLAIFFGGKKKKLFTMGDFDPEQPFERSGCNSRARHNYYLKLQKEHEEYQTSYASYSWARAAVRAGKRAVASTNAASIRIPVLLFQATEDTFVRATEQDLFLSGIPDGRKIIVESRHEINRDTNDHLEVYLSQIFAFFLS